MIQRFMNKTPKRVTPEMHKKHSIKRKQVLFIFIWSVHGQFCFCFPFFLCCCTDWKRKWKSFTDRNKHSHVPGERRRACFKVSVRSALPIFYMNENRKQHNQSKSLPFLTSNPTRGLYILMKTACKCVICGIAREVPLSKKNSGETIPVMGRVHFNVSPDHRQREKERVCWMRLDETDPSPAPGCD